MSTSTQGRLDHLFENTGYLPRIELRMTSDAHSRRLVVDGKCWGTIMFHDHEFKWEPYDETSGPFRMRWLPLIINEIKRDTSIAYQFDADQKERQRPAATTSALA